MEARLLVVLEPPAKLVTIKSVEVACVGVPELTVPKAFAAASIVKVKVEPTVAVKETDEVAAFTKSIKWGPKLTIKNMAKLIKNTGQNSVFGIWYLVFGIWRGFLNFYKKFFEFYTHFLFNYLKI